MPATIWIGGATASGKTTIARQLGARHGLRRFHIDNYWYAHDAVLREPKLTADEQWLGLSPSEQADEFHATSRRRFALALRDVDTLPDEPPAVVEGPQVLPELLPTDAQAVFLVATPEFQGAVLRHRPLPHTADPERALENRIEKDRLFGERVANEAVARGFAVLLVDGTRSMAEILADVERRLAGAPALTQPPVAAVDFRAVRRWENEVLAANVRSWIGSPDVIEGALPPWPFACECGKPSCDGVVSLTLEEFDGAATVRSRGH